MQVVVINAEGREEYHLLDPVEVTEFGFDVRGAVIGEEHKGRVKTGAEYADERLDRLAMGAESADEVAAKRKEKAQPFGGEINPYLQAEQYTPPAWMPKRGTEMELEGAAVVRPAVGLVAALSRIAHLAGEAWAPEHSKFIRQRYPDGVPEEQIPILAEQIRNGGEESAEPVRAAGGLRVIK